VASWLAAGGGWGTREQAIPGEWATLVLLMVLGAALGLLVLWFTALRHERTVRRRASLRRKPDGMGLTGVGTAASQVAAGVAEAADQKSGDGDGADEGAEVPDDASKPSGAGADNQRKLTDEILSRVESELAARETPRWKELATLVQDEYGVTVHPSSIQKAVKRRRLAAETA
jgi:HAMP domain-containing protein